MGTDSPTDALTWRANSTSSSEAWARGFQESDEEASSASAGSAIMQGCPRRRMHSEDQESVGAHQIGREYDQIMTSAKGGRNRSSSPSLYAGPATPGSASHVDMSSLAPKGSPTRRTWPPPRRPLPRSS